MLIVAKIGSRSIMGIGGNVDCMRARQLRHKRTQGTSIMAPIMTKAMPLSIIYPSIHPHAFQ